MEPGAPSIVSGAHNRPPCDWTMEHLMDKAIPLPWVLVVKKAAKIWSPLSVGNPTDTGVFARHRSSLFTSTWFRRKLSKVRAALVPPDGSPLFFRTRLRRNHACYAIVDTQLTVNFTRMFDQIVR